MYISNLNYKKTGILLSILFGVSIYTIAQTNIEPKKKTRAEGFFGIHLDFHANFNDSMIGINMTSEEIDSLLTKVKPDFIQVDCKGHPGFSSYPTKVGNQTNGYQKDILKMFREETDKYKVPLFVHYSGVIDGRAVELHPEWAMKEGWNTPHGWQSKETSRHSGYVDSLMLPQLKELIDAYHIDGIWVDGDNWGSTRDYSPKAVADFKAKTGIAIAPLTGKDAGWLAWTQFQRNSFKNYMRKYVDAIHKYKPGFQISSNWAYSAMMPQPVDVNLDFLSGDVSPKRSVNSAAFEARCLALQGKPWDLMSWSFNFNYNTSFGSPKHVDQLKQEAAEVIAMGGSYQIYYNQNRDGSLKPWTFEGAAQVGKFCREREKYTKNNISIPQVAVLHSTYNYENFGDELWYSFGFGDQYMPLEVYGTTVALLDKQYSVQVVMEHNLKGKMKEFPVIVVPAVNKLAPDFKKELLAYANDGGMLILLGPNPVQLFAEETTTKITKRVPDFTNLGYKKRMGNLTGDYLEVSLPKDVLTLGTLHKESDLRLPSVPGASIQAFGKGKIASIYFSLGSAYLKNRTLLDADFLGDIVHELIPVPAVKVEGSPYVHINLAKKDGKTYLHMINTAGNHDNENVYETAGIPVLHDLKVSLFAEKMPAKLILLPEKTELKFTYQNNMVAFSIPSLDIYKIVEVVQK